MADVWLWAGNPNFDDGWKSRVSAVVLPNNKVLAKDSSTRKYLEEMIEFAKENYENWDENDEDLKEYTKPPLQEHIFGTLNDVIGGRAIFSCTGIFPIEEAFEFLALTAGFGWDDWSDESTNETHSDGPFLVAISSASDTGLVRKNNEDSLFYRDSENTHPIMWSTPERVRRVCAMAVVADGMGGPPAGEVASEIAATSIRDRFDAWMTIVQPTIYQEIQASNSFPAFPFQEAFEEANKIVLEEATRDRQKKGMGTTCTVAVTLEDQLFIGHIGDSRAYLYRDNTLKQLTRDHSAVQDMVDNKTITPEQAWGHPRSNMITRYIGDSAKPITPQALPPLQLLTGDRILLCSDGLHDMLRDTEIADILQRKTRGEETAKSLVNAANNAGGRDNVTVIVLDVLSEHTPSIQGNSDIPDPVKLKEDAIEAFKTGMIEGLELLQAPGNEYAAAFTFDDCTMLLPPDKRVDRGGASEWARAWWQGPMMPFAHGFKAISDPDEYSSDTWNIQTLMPINLSNMITGFSIPDSPEWPTEAGGSDIYMAGLGVRPVFPEILISRILSGKELSPNPSGADLSEPDHSDAYANEGKLEPPFDMLVGLQQVSEYIHHFPETEEFPRRNAALGLIHAYLAGQPVVPEGIHALIEAYKTRIEEDPDNPMNNCIWGLEALFGDSAGSNKGGNITDEVWELLTVPLDRIEWARTNDELAIKYLSRAIRYSHWSHVFPLSLSMALCIYRSGVVSPSIEQLRLLDAQPHTDTPVRGRSPILLSVSTDQGNESEHIYYVWDNLDSRDREDTGDTVSPETYVSLFEDILKGQQIAAVFTGTEITVGRSRNNDIVLDSSNRISRRHAKLYIKFGVIWIEDLNSRNGTRLNGQRIDGLPPQKIPVSQTDIRDLNNGSQMPTPAIDIANDSFSISVIYPDPENLHGNLLPSDNRFKDIFDIWTHYQYNWLAISYNIPYEKKENLSGATERILLLRNSLSSPPDHALELLGRVRQLHEQANMNIPFEVYYLESKCYSDLGQLELARERMELAETVLSQEFDSPNP